VIFPSDKPQKKIDTTALQLSLYQQHWVIPSWKADSRENILPENTLFSNGSCFTKINMNVRVQFHLFYSIIRGFRKARKGVRAL